jgi:hypothetical protein
MIDELVKTVRLHLSERLTSPLMGAYIVSWCLWNYKTILVLLSAEPVLDKFRILHDVVYPDWQHIVGPGLLLPLVMCLVYLYLYPYPAKAVYVYTRKRQREILEARRKSEDETPLTIEDSRKIKDQLAKAEIAHYEEIDRKDAEIERLKVQITNLRNELASARSNDEAAAKNPFRVDHRRTDAPSALPALLMEVLNAFAIHSAGYVHVGHLTSTLPTLDRVSLEYALGELAQMNLLATRHDPNGITSYALTHEGRGVLMRTREVEKA